MGKIDFDALPENSLLLAGEGAEFLGISRRYFYQLELRKFFGRATKRGFPPRYFLRTLREFKQRAYDTGFLPLRVEGVTVDMRDPETRDDEFVTMTELRQYLRLSVSEFYSLLTKGLLPSPYRFRENSRPRWKVGEIRQCLRQEDAAGKPCNESQAT